MRKGLKLPWSFLENVAVEPSLDHPRKLMSLSESLMLVLPKGGIVGRKRIELNGD